MRSDRFDAWTDRASITSAACVTTRFTMRLSQESEVKCVIASVWWTRNSRAGRVLAASARIRSSSYEPEGTSPDDQPAKSYATRAKLTLNAW